MKLEMFTLADKCQVAVFVGNGMAASVPQSDGRHFQRLAGKLSVL
jgi:hypothetical protein